MAQKKYSVYEIEMKAEPLSEQKFLELRALLPTRFQESTVETLTSERFRPGDVRVRWGEKGAEIVEKTGDAASIVRYETITPLESVEEAQAMRERFREQGRSADPTWLKHKWEYTTEREGHEYVICLQHIENFAYILEVEHICPIDDSELHRPHIEAIIRELGCIPLDAAQFRRRIETYIAQNKERL